ncbi:MAG TPA: class D sortase [Candidatus Dormibacteraeota bacterium]|nr:class D sortase [Candidatus Dormibacteraeota bacterium]
MTDQHPGGPGWGWAPPPPTTPPARPGGRPRPSLRAVALALIAIGALVCLVPVGIVAVGMWQESQLTDSWSSSQTATLPSPPFIEEGGPAPTASPDASPSPAPSASPRVSHPAVQAAFAMRVPKIGYYAAVREGVSLSVLSTGPGHYPTTALPGGPGLIGIAAHNTFWIPFGQLGPGDTVVLETRTAKFTYRITGTRIVNPDDRTVLVPTSDPSLVLTTCWPLWAGNLAPQRLAIFAQQV